MSVAAASTAESEGVPVPVSILTGNEVSHLSTTFEYNPRAPLLANGRAATIFVIGVGEMALPEDVPAIPILEEIRAGRGTLDELLRFMTRVESPLVTKVASSKKGTPVDVAMFYDAQTGAQRTDETPLKQRLKIVLVSHRLAFSPVAGASIVVKRISEESFARRFPKINGGLLTAAAYIESSRVFQSFDVSGVVQLIKSRNIKNILVMCGAGISVAAGIPDFRTPGTGLYSRLEKYKLPRPESLFTLDYFKERPEMFYEVSDDMQLWPGIFPPTIAHHFVAMLHEKGRLLRCFTQNIDCLEREAGLPDEKLVEAHGTFATARCVGCKAEQDIEMVKACAKRRAVPRCTKCDGVVKPDVVFFGEGLPRRYGTQLQADLPNTELLLVMGTSLQVYPFAAIHEIVDDSCPRVLINRDRAGDFTFVGDEDTLPGKEGEAFIRDVFLSGDCQAQCMALATGLGFGRELEERYAAAKAANAARVKAASSGGDKAGGAAAAAQL